MARILIVRDDAEGKRIQYKGKTVILKRDTISDAFAHELSNAGHAKWFRYIDPTPAPKSEAAKPNADDQESKEESKSEPRSRKPSKEYLSGTIPLADASNDVE